MAANIQEAIDDIVEDISIVGATIATRMGTWVSEMFTEASFPTTANFWDKDSADERTVFDWVVPNLLAQQEIDSIGDGAAFGDAILGQNIAINIVLRTLLAVQAAENEGRITTAQESDVVTAYTDAWE